MRISLCGVITLFALALPACRSDAAMPDILPVPPALVEYFEYSIDVFFAANAVGIPAAQRERVAKQLSKARTAGPLVKWCAVLHGYADTTEGTPTAVLALSARRNESVREFLVRYGLSTSDIQLFAIGSKNALFARRDHRNSRVEIEQFPCKQQ